MIHRTHITLLSLCMVLFAAHVGATPTAPPIGVDERVVEPNAGAIQDAGLWLLIGGGAVAAAGTGVALGMVAWSDTPPETRDFDFGTFQQIRIAGATAALIAVVGGAVALSGVGMLLWPEE